MSLKLQHLTLENINEILYQSEQNATSSYLKMKIKYRKLLVTTNSNILCAIENNEVVGQVVYDSDSEHNKLYYKSSLISSKHEKTNLLSKMLTKIENRASIKNVSEAYFSVNASDIKQLGALLETGLFISDTKKDVVNDKNFFILKKKISDKEFHKKIKSGKFRKELVPIDKNGQVSLKTTQNLINNGFIGIKVDTEKNSIIFIQVYRPNNERPYEDFIENKNTIEIEPSTDKKAKSKIDISRHISKQNRR